MKKIYFLSVMGLALTPILQNNFFFPPPKNLNGANEYARGGGGRND